MMRSRWLGYIVAALAAAASAWAYPRLPPRVAIHWSLSGQPDGYGSKLLAAVLLPLMILAMRGLLSVLPRIDPKGENYPKFASTYWLIFNGVIVFFGVIHLAVLAYGLGAPVRMDRVVAAGVGVLLIVIGNYITRVEPNWFIGIRTPWTLSSDRVWRRTHRVGGWILVTGGALVVLSLFVPAGAALPILIATIALVAVVPVVLSYLWWRRERAGARQT
ncbi:MAG: SdpI family protein [Gemmatimonadetes bacterium]|nr:SdpI family protein [Gemmatimonadota bacterium]